MDDPNITMKEYIRLDEEKAQKREKVFNWKTAKYEKIWDVIESCMSIPLLRPLLMAYLVKISKKACILELKQRNRKKLILTSYMSYPSRKIWCICACTSLKTTKEQGSIRHPILYLASLKTSWKYSPKKPVIYHRRQALVINAEPISVMHPSNIAKNIMDSRNTSSEEGGLSLIGHDAPSYLEVCTKLKVAEKRKVDVGSHGEDPYRKAPKKFPSAKELKDTNDCLWVISHVTPPSWKQYLREIIIEQLCDIHDKAYMRKAVLDNVLNGRARELFSALPKARASCDTIRERVRLMVSTLLQEVDSLRKDSVAVVARVISDVAMKLIRSDEMGVLIARLVKASIIHGRCTTFEEVAELKKLSILEEMSGYRPSSKEEYNRAGNDLADASYRFLAELTVDPHASME
ncbi:hypothetical protein Tco_0596352 [Tanacetum coccineum]